MSGDEWRGIMLLGQLREGQLRRPTLELLAKARDLGDRLGARVTCILVGQGASAVAETAIHHGADKVLHADVEHDGFQATPLVEPMTRLVREHQPEILLLSATDLGRDLGPMLGARLDTGVAQECIDLDIDASNRTLLAKRLTFQDQLIETLVTPTARPQIATLRPGAAREGFPDDFRFGDTEELDLTLGEGPRVVQVTEGAPPQLLWAETAVVGGRGVPQERWDELEGLAQALGGAVGATRGAIHGKRAGEEAHVGARGQRIKPKLYLGFGVSGDFDHVLGIKEAEWVVAITRDPEAPLVKRADWALVTSDEAEAAKALRDQVEKRRR